MEEQEEINGEMESKMDEKHWKSNMYRDLEKQMIENRNEFWVWEEIH